MNIQKLLIFIFLLSTFAQANEGPVSANAVVSNKNILSGNVVSLHIRATGQQAVFPMVKNIDGVKILSSDERITNMHVYNNGKLKKECTILTLTFAPQKDMTIPSYEVEIEGRIYKTKPIKLKMKDTTTSNQNKSDIFSLKLKSNQKRVNVGEAFLVTVRLSLQDNFIISKKLQYHRPKFEGFFVEQIGKGKSYDDKNGHLVTEIKYILTPHSEGSYILGPAYAKIGLQDRSKKRMVNVDKSRKMFQRASNTLELEVLPKTTQSDLVGAFALESNIDTQKVAAGKPVKLRIKIKGPGDLTRFDFPDYTLEGVTVYSDEAKVNIREVDAKIYSSYSKEFVFISEEDFTIPEQTFTMYDPKDGTLKELKISSIDIRVDQSDAITVKTKISKSFTPNTSIKNEAMKLKEKLEDIPSYWWILLLSFIVGGLFFYLLRYLPKQKQRSYKESEALKILLPHISEDPGVEEMVLKLYARKNGDRSVKINKKKLKMLLARFS